MILTEERFSLTRVAVTIATGGLRAIGRMVVSMPRWLGIGGSTVFVPGYG